MLAHEMRWTAMLGALALMMTTLGAGCGCPDLAYPGLLVDRSDLGGGVSLVCTATQGGSTVLENQAISTGWELDLEQGLYDLTFYVEGVLIGRVSQVCSVGYLSGCSAEDAEANGTLVRVATEGDAYSVELIRNRGCED